MEGERHVIWKELREGIMRKIMETKLFEEMIA
jgi:hypothetical protein